MPFLGEVRHSLGPDGPGSQFHSAYLPRILRKSEFLTKERSRGRPMGWKPRLCSFGEALQLVVPEQPRAPVIEVHFEDQVLWRSPGVGPLAADRAQQPRNSEGS